MTFSALAPARSRCHAALLRFAAFFALTLTALAQSDWRWVNPLPGGTYHAVAFGSGVYVAVGIDGMIATSPDTITWTVRRQASATAVLNNVAFAGGRFVAVGQNTANGSTTGAAYILTSTDGITWTQATMTSTFNSQLFDVVHSGSLWMAGGLSSPSAFATSTDGLTWTVRGPNTGDALLRGAYGNGRFVFLNDQNRVNTSTDGATWSRSFVVGTADNNNVGFQDITFANGVFYAAGRDASFNGTVYTSTDGATWTLAASVPNSSGGFTTITHSNGTFLAAGNAGFFTSTNGTSWTKGTSPLAASRSTESIDAVTSANGLMFTLGIYGSITTSPDGTTWTRRTIGTVQDLGGLVHDGTRFVATGTSGAVVTSPDGTTWTTVSSGSTASFGKLAFGNGRYATAGQNGLYHSANLTSWTQPSGTNNEMFGVIFANDRFIASNKSLALGIRTSTDGSTWTNVTVSGTPSQQVQGLAGGGGNFVITTGGFGAAAKIFASANGTTWADRTPTTYTDTANSLAYGNGRFVLLTSFAAWTSTDGVTWTANALPSTGYVSRVQYVGSKFIGRSSTNTIYRSSLDGVTWSDIENSAGPNYNIEAMIEFGGAITAVGAAGMILRADLPASPNAPKVASAPQSQTISSGGTTVFSVSATGAGLSYQWRFNGTAISGANGATYVLRGATSANAGSYTCLITNSFGSTTSAAATLAISTSADFGRISNLSVLTGITATEPSFTVGTVIGGGGTSGNKAIVVRAVGPSLGALGVPGTISDPQMKLFNGSSVEIASNDNWNGVSSLQTAMASVGAFAYTGATSKDAAISESAVSAGAYSVAVSGVAGATGSVIAEIYDATPTSAFTTTTTRLTNVSVLKSIPASGTLTLGFTIGGTTAKTVLIRAIGPGLAAVGLTSGTLADPSLTLFNSASTSIASNDNWGGDTQLTAVGTAVGAFAVSSATSKDAMLLVTLSPGGYTAQAAGVGGTGGIAIVEVYEVP